MSSVMLDRRTVQSDHRTSFHWLLALRLKYCQSSTQIASRNFDLSRRNPIFRLLQLWGHRMQLILDLNSAVIYPCIYYEKKSRCRRDTWHPDQAWGPNRVRVGAGIIAHMQIWICHLLSKKPRVMTRMWKNVFHEWVQVYMSHRRYKS